MRIVKRFLPAVLSIAILSSVTYAAAPDRISGPIDSSQMIELTGHVSLLARPQFDQGPVETSRTMHVTMLFLPTAQQEQALKELLAEQQDKQSSHYHKWLTVSEYADQFGLSTGDVQKVKAWLQAQGFKVTYTANGRDFISFQGTASQVESVFRTQIHNFNVNGKMHFANVTPPMIPAALSGIVGGFRGLHNFLPQSMLRQRPSYTFTDGANTYTALAPADIATIYDITPLYSAGINGAGVNVVIAGQTDVYIADINFFRGAFSLTPLSGCTLDSTQTILQAGKCSAGNFQEVWPDGDPGFSPGDLGESDLDIETMSGVAPGAEIVFVTSPVNDGGVDTSVSYAVDQTPPLGKVISYSYGLCEPLVTAPGIEAAEPTYAKADSLGISMFVASGDSASAICDAELRSTNTQPATEPAIYGATVSYPASSTYVTAVGGTEFDEDSGTGPYWNSTNAGNGGSAIKYIPETAWNDTSQATSAGGDVLDGSGGGPSNCATGTGTTTVSGSAFELCTGGFPKPTWQSSVTPSDSARDVPDISFSASNFNDPYIVCTAQSETNGSSSTSTCVNGITNALITYNSAFGGTSAPTPVTAGMTALLNQYMGTDGLGLINPQLYTLFESNPTGVFNEINSGTNGVTGGSSSNVVTCTEGDPTFETSTTLVCPSTGASAGEIGFTVAGGHAYSQVTGVGSVDIDGFVKAWAASVTDFTLSAGTPSPTSVAAGNSATATVTIAPLNGFTGPVTLSCPNPPAGVSCPTFSPNPVTGGSGTSTVTIQTSPNMASGSTTVTVTGTATGAAPSSATVNLTVTPTSQSFTLTSQNATYTVTPGQPATVNVTLASTNGFVNGQNQTVVPVTYTCGDTASESLCTGPSTPVTSTSVSFTITTTAATAKLRRPFDRGSRIFYATLLPGLLGIMFAFGSRKQSLRGMRMLGLIMVLGFSTLWLGSCGGSNNSTSSNPGTPAGNYTITINATTGGANPVKNSTTVTLAVQ
jgi:subtilase family serine protease